MQEDTVSTLGWRMLTRTPHLEAMTVFQISLSTVHLNTAASLDKVDKLGHSLVVGTSFDQIPRDGKVLEIRPLLQPPSVKNQNFRVPEEQQK